MGTLDFRHIEKARGITDQQAPRESQLRNRLQAAFRNRARAVRDPGAAFENGADGWDGF